jgi:hypothetical protein
MEDDKRKISLEESRDLSLKLEKLLVKAEGIISRKAALQRENKVEMDRCEEEIDRVREIIRTGKINEDMSVQDELFDDDETTNFNVSVVFSSMQSGMPICEIHLQDVHNFAINQDKKDTLKTEFNNALYNVKQSYLGHTKLPFSNN